MSWRPTRKARALATAAALLVALAAGAAQGTRPAPQTGPQLDRPARVGKRPNLNGIWQAMNTANWDIEAHPAEPLNDFWRLGAISAIPAGISVVRGGTIPYKPEALATRAEHRAKWPAADPEAKCFMLGVPRATYHDMPFQIFQADEDDLLFVYPFAATNRIIHMTDTAELPVDSWMGKSMGTWDDDVLVVTTKWQNGRSWLDRAGNHYSNQATVTERFRLASPHHIWYEATIDDPQTFTRAWTLEMPLYRQIEPNAQLLEHKCVPFADKLLYQDLLQNETKE